MPPLDGCAVKQELIRCPPVEVALVSATVADGQLVVWECGVDQRQCCWLKSLSMVRRRSGWGPAAPVWRSARLQ